MRKNFSWSKRLLLVFLFFFLFLSLTGQVFAFWGSERKIIVFRREVSPQRQNELLAKLKITPQRSLRLINAQTAILSSRQVRFLLKDHRVLRIDPDVRVYALPRRDRSYWCERYPWLPWCPQPSPTPTSTPTPSPSPTPSPLPTSTPTPSLTPTPLPTPTSVPSPTPTPTPAKQPLPWGVARIKADRAWTTATGKGVKVAVIDSGVDIDHPDLDDNLFGCVNFISWWRSCNDDYGHGTHVAGIIAAEDNSFGVVGVAPKARLYALKVLDWRGYGYLSDVIEALDWSVANQVDVVNMSFGTASDVSSLHEAIQRVKAAGIVQVAAAGNSGPDPETVLYPARYPEVIAVAATDSNDQVPSWSSRGTEVDLAAPGKEIKSTYLRGRYKTLSGTSMSAPHVAGVAALRLEDHPNEEPTAIETLLENQSDSLPWDPTLVGAGLVNAYRVVTAP